MKSETKEYAMVMDEEGCVEEGCVRIAATNHQDLTAK